MHTSEGSDAKHHLQINAARAHGANLWYIFHNLTDLKKLNRAYAF